MQDTEKTAETIKRDEILTELWDIVEDYENPGNVKVAALDKIARIEGAYKPIVIESKKKFQSLADFYRGVEVPTEEEQEEAPGEEEAE